VGLAGLLCLTGIDAAYWFQRTHHNSHLRITYLDVGQGALHWLNSGESECSSTVEAPGDDFDVERWWLLLSFSFKDPAHRLSGADSS
jgi:hypothetical protein